MVYLVNRPDLPSGPGPVVESPLPTLSSSPSASPTTPQEGGHTHPARVGRHTPPPEPTVDKIPVTVLNNSTITGLAAAAADQLRGAHWPIRLVGNFRGRLPISTAYYDPGQKTPALLLAKEFPAVRRVLPRFDGLPGHGLTLVVTREWPA